MIAMNFVKSQKIKIYNAKLRSTNKTYGFN